MGGLHSMRARGPRATAAVRGGGVAGTARSALSDVLKTIVNAVPLAPRATRSASVPAAGLHPLRSALQCWTEAVPGPRGRARRRAAAGDPGAGVAPGASGGPAARRWRPHRGAAPPDRSPSPLGGHDRMILTGWLSLIDHPIVLTSLPASREPRIVRVEHWVREERGVTWRRRRQPSCFSSGLSRSARRRSARHSRSGRRSHSSART